MKNLDVLRDVKNMVVVVPVDGDLLNTICSYSTG